MLCLNATSLVGTGIKIFFLPTGRSGCAITAITLYPLKIIPSKTVADISGVPIKMIRLLFIRIIIYLKILTIKRKEYNIYQ